jgi:hypothetical protein
MHRACLGANSNHRRCGGWAARAFAGTCSAGPLLVKCGSSPTAEVGTRNSSPAERTCTWPRGSVLAQHRQAMCGHGRAATTTFSGATPLTTHRRKGRVGRVAVERPALRQTQATLRPCALCQLRLCAGAEEVPESIHSTLFKCQLCNDLIRWC